MILKGVRDFFLRCDLFKGKSINVNFLAHNEGAVSIEPFGSLSVVKKYCDGKKVFSQDYYLSVRCGFDANIELNLKDAAFLESVCLWLDEQNQAGNLPYLGDRFIADRIIVTKAPYLYESSVQGARMQIDFSLIYREV